MQHRGKGNFGVEVDHPKFGLITQWFRAENTRNEYFGNLNRDPAYRGKKNEKGSKRLRSCNVGATSRDVCLRRLQNCSKAQ